MDRLVGPMLRCYFIIIRLWTCYTTYNVFSHKLYITDLPKNQVSMAQNRRLLKDILYSPISSFFFSAFYSKQSQNVRRTSSHIQYFELFALKSMTWAQQIQVLIFTTTLYMYQVLKTYLNSANHLEKKVLSQTTLIHLKWRISYKT